MTYNVLVRSNPTKGYIATALAFPGYSAEAATRQEALNRLYTTILKLISESELVAMDIPARVVNPVQAETSDEHETFGMFRTDPTYAAFLQEVEAYRLAHNQIIE